MSDQIDMDHLNKWIGKEQVETCIITPEPFSGMIATLDIKNMTSNAGTALPPLWQWLYFLPHAPASEIGHDGHPKKGGFMPPVPLPRRMWVGEKLKVSKPVLIGDEVTKTSRIASISLKNGKSGPLIFVTLAIDFSVAGETRMQEELRVVYREEAPVKTSVAPETTATKKPEKAATSINLFKDEFQPDWCREIQPDPVLLFRYSALTFNSHRIHYDRKYAMEEEGYPGLVVHGPLAATFLSDLVQRSLPDTQIAEYECRAISPLFDMNPFTLMAKKEGKIVHLRSVNHKGIVSMEATAKLA